MAKLYSKLTALILILALAGCTNATKFGPCEGVNSDWHNPKLEYRLSAWNIFLGLIFSETIIVPIFVLVDQTYCPVGYKEVPVNK